MVKIIGEYFRQIFALVFDYYWLLLFRDELFSFLMVFSFEAFPGERRIEELEEHVPQENPRRRSDVCI